MNPPRIMLQGFGLYFRVLFARRGYVHVEIGDRTKILKWGGL